MSQSSWVHVHPEKPGNRLFCFPYAGGGASIYRLWQQALPEVEVCPVQLPGRENRLREPAFTNVNGLVQELVSVLKPYLNVPFQFFGHSMGALISFELARQLRREHMPEPTRLLLSAHRAPQRPYQEKLLHLMSDEEFMQTLKTLGGTPEIVLQHRELMQILLPLLRADFTLYETYHYIEEPPLAYPLAIMGGVEDTEVSVADLEVWQQQSNQPTSLKLFPGGHFYLHVQQEALLRYLRSFYQ